MKSSIIYLFTICLLSISCQESKGNKKMEKKQNSKPNIVFILTDDHAYQALSAYNNSLIRTPNIDNIAQEGALFEQARVTNSICSPSRAVILTGKYSHINGMKDNGTYFNGDQPTLQSILGENGYSTAIIGKWHLFSDPTGFDYWNILPDQGHYYNPDFIKMGKDTVYDGYVTDVITDLSLEWIEQNKEKPFALMLQHKAPHRNWMPPLHYIKEYKDRDFELPENFYDNYENRKALQEQMFSVQGGYLDIRYDTKIPCDSCPVTEVNQWAPDEFKREIERLTPEEKQAWDNAYAQDYEKFSSLKGDKDIIEWQFQRYMEDYLACVKSVDDNVGRVLDYLRENDLDENTIVVYMSDQGFYLGEHGLYDKRFMYEESFRTPLMMKYPKQIPSAQKIDEYALNLDLAPTLLDFAGIDIPEDIQGESMVNLLKDGKDNNWREEVYYHYYEKSFGATAHYGIKTPRYKLIHFYDPVDSWELYDLKHDPKEMKNIYGADDYVSIVDDLKEAMYEQQRKYGDEEALEFKE